jgi:outer membrane protein
VTTNNCSERFDELNEFANQTVEASCESALTKRCVARRREFDLGSADVGTEPARRPRSRVALAGGRGNRQRSTSLGEHGFSVDGDKIYSLAELIDLAEAHNPETRVAWESARTQAAALEVARSELYPTLSAVALAGVDRDEAGSGRRFYRQTMPDYQVELDLNYMIFDFGARRGRIDAACAQLLAANFGFNDLHRKLICSVQQAYYRLLNASAQESAARASLDNAQAVQQAAEEQLKNGLATRPDVLEARSATARAQI